MKLSMPISLLAILPFVTHVSAGIFPRQTFGGNRGGRNGGGGGNNDGGNNNTNPNTGVNTNSTSNTGGSTNTTGTGANTGGNVDPQTSLSMNSSVSQHAKSHYAVLALDPRVIAKGFANDGQDVPTAGQVASLTSTNNFINFCLTVPDLPITDGKQITAGSCNPAPIGVIPSTDQMPSAKFTFPKNGGTIPSDEAFTISMAIKNLQTGAFVNAQENYFAAPQQLNGQGTIIGHSHVVAELLDSVDQTTPTDPKKFAFFKGLNAAAVNGVLTADVTDGLPAGAYRLCSINSSSNHQPVIVAVAQHGSLDDCVYFTASPGGTVAGGNNGASTGTAAAGATGAGTGTTNNTTATAGAANASSTTRRTGGRSRGGRATFAREY
ncbi:hypothetical protein P691DRAFT_780284 [Macrolepiota fuliginosa MF-IS2]|uniref:Ribosomal protein s17 n=1 Tax=Macrolepiota fuliginosa MF-IS2 TaxID=1400762 RepID=A0A9P5XSJ5_9AGAR|nr:hypothetical protein P691DRAFT_780284 [Macrolepiota fuliginosa MF-IS2]